MDKNIEIKILKQQIRDLKNKLFEIDMLSGPGNLTSQNYINDLEKENKNLRADKLRLLKIIKHQRDSRKNLQNKTK